MYWKQTLHTNISFTGNTFTVIAKSLAIMNLALA